MIERSERLRPRGREIAVPILAGLFALAIGYGYARPFGAANIAFDSQVAVLHFQRIVSGVRLETFISTTPKPLLTAVFGVLYSLTSDWRSLSIATLLAYVVAVVLAAILAMRLRGPIAGLAAGVAVAVAPSLLFDVGYALATPWAAIGWFAAGLAVTARRPRYGLAGVALGLATLARVETAVVTGVALLVLASAWVGAGVLRRPSLRPAARAWLVPLIGLSAFIVMMLHDWRLTGDPLFWTTVARRYTQGTTLHVMSAREVVSTLVHRYRLVPVMSILAVVGAIELIRRRSWPVLVGLVGLGPGIAAFLVVLAIEGIFVSDRYFAGIDVAVAFASGIGVGACAAWLGARWPTDLRLGSEATRVMGRLAGLVALAAVLVLVAVPSIQVEPGLPGALATARRLAADADAAVPILAAQLGSATAPGVPGEGGVPQPSSSILVPGPVWPRLVVDLRSLATVVVATRASDIDLARGYPAPGQTIFHSDAGDPPSDGWSQLEVSVPTTIDGVVVDPLRADAAAGTWILRIVRAAR